MRTENDATGGVGQGWTAVLFFCVIALCGCEERIFHDLDEVQANRVRLVLARTGIDARKVREGSLWSIAVAADKTAAALAAVEKGRVLRRDLRHLRERSKGLLDSREERRQAIDEQREASLAETLEILPGVLEARVHFHPEGNAATSTAVREDRPSASVLLVVEENEWKGEERVVQLVSGGLGLNREAVTVVAASIDSPRDETLHAHAGSVEKRVAAPSLIPFGIRPLDKHLVRGAALLVGLSGIVCLALRRRKRMRAALPETAEHRAQCSFEGASASAEPGVSTGSTRPKGGDNGSSNGSKKLRPANVFELNGVF